MPQYYLAPYYQIIDGHHPILTSASQYSLIVTFIKDLYRDKTGVTAQVSGGSGDYSYHWYYYQLETFFDEGITDLTIDHASIEIPESNYAWVSCHVLDRKTKAYIFHTEQVIGNAVVHQQNNLIS